MCYLYITIEVVYIFAYIFSLGIVWNWKSLLSHTILMSWSIDLHVPCLLLAASTFKYKYFANCMLSEWPIDVFSIQILPTVAGHHTSENYQNIKIWAHFFPQIFDKLTNKNPRMGGKKGSNKCKCNMKYAWTRLARMKLLKCWVSNHRPDLRFIITHY